MDVGLLKCIITMLVCLAISLKKIPRPLPQEILKGKKDSKSRKISRLGLMKGQFSSKSSNTIRKIIFSDSNFAIVNNSFYRPPIMIKK